MRVGITANPKKPAAVELAQHAVERIGARAETILSDEIRSVGAGRPHVPLAELAADVTIAIGGDGTFLYALRRSSVPLLPVNAGTLGVLAEIDGRRLAEFDSAIDRVLEGRYYLEERSKLAGEIGGTPLPDAVNEYVVHSARVGRMGLFELAFDGRAVGQIRADGLIVATPTGSTAYALSSFGPIVDPAVDGIVVTAIAPFRLESRALVVDPVRTITVRALEGDGGSVVLADGEGEHPLAPGAAVTLYRSPRRASLVRFGSSFFDRLRGKRILPWSETPAGGPGPNAGVPPPP